MTFYNPGRVKTSGQWKTQIFQITGDWTLEMESTESLVNGMLTSKFWARQSTIVIAQDFTPRNTPSFDNLFESGNPVFAGMIAKNRRLC